MLQIPNAQKESDYKKDEKFWLLLVLKGGPSDLGTKVLQKY